MKTTIMVWNEQRILVKVVDAGHDSDDAQIALFDMLRMLGVERVSDHDEWQMWEGEAKVEVLP